MQTSLFLSRQKYILNPQVLQGQSTGFIPLQRILYCPIITLISLITEINNIIPQVDIPGLLAEVTQYSHGALNNPLPETP